MGEGASHPFRASEAPGAGAANAADDARAPRPRRLAGRVALVTGAGQGSGRGCALALADEGARLALVGRTRAKLDAVCAEIEARGGEAACFPCDVGQLDEVGACVEGVVAALGPVRALVQTAQSPALRSSALLDVEAGVVDELWRTGPLASLAFMRACHPHLRGGGAIVNFGTGAQFAPGGFGAYAAAKAAIQMLTRAAAEEWGPDGIRANLVVPYVASPAADLEFGEDEARRAASIARIPLRRVGDPERDLGRAVAFLASDDASYLTGSTLLLDGGMMFLR